MGTKVNFFLHTDFALLPTYFKLHVDFITQWLTYFLYAYNI